ncbi:1,4-beta-glucanase [Streptomyces sp. NBC_00344]|uniref:1,4-beta-glucanase n=1 Tax=Streptomyces sp. NBC_00344 TaxID=2975720 RepID=UPI002E231138
MTEAPRTPRRRTVLAGAGVAAAAVLPGAPAAAASARTASGSPATAGSAAQPHRWRTAVIGGTGFITGVLFHPRVKGLAYARTDIGGAYRWEQWTSQWVPLNDRTGWDDWNLMGVEAIAVDEAHPDRLYLAVGTYTTSGNGAVLCSGDRGATWTRNALPAALGANENGRGTGERLLVDPGDSDTLWLGTRHDGLLTSADRGNTWAAATGFPAVQGASGQGVTLVVAAGRTLYAGWGDGGTALYRRSGSGWAAVPGQPSGESAKVPVRAAYDRATHALYVTYADTAGPNDQTTGSVHRLNTLTGRWTEVTPVQPGGVTAGGAADTFGYGGVSVDARRPGTLVVSTNNRWSDTDTLFRSTDGGRNWTSLKDTAVLDVSRTPYLNWGTTAKFGWWIQTAGIDPHDSEHIVYGTGATLYATHDLIRWTPQIRGLEESAVVLLVSPPAGRAHLLSGLGDIGVMYHESLTSSPSLGMASNPVFGTATGLAFAALKPSYTVRTGWSSGSNGACSDDGGRTWRPFAAQPEIAAAAPGPIAVSADGSTLLWSFIHWDGTTYAAHRSTDGGASWAEVPSFPRGATPLADPVDPSRFHAYDTGTGTVFLSTDCGATFTAGATGLPSGDNQFRIAAAPGRSGDLWLSAKWNGLHRSTDGGVTFTRIGSCWASYVVGFGKAAESAGYPAIFQVGSTETITAVHRSDDAGASWLRINDDAHQWGWTGAAISGDPRIHGRVYLGTNGRGIQYADPEWERP